MFRLARRYVKRKAVRQAKRSPAWSWRGVSLKKLLLSWFFGILNQLDPFWGHKGTWILEFIACTTWAAQETTLAEEDSPPFCFQDMAAASAAAEQYGQPPGSWPRIFQTEAAGHAVEVDNHQNGGWCFIVLKIFCCICLEKCKWPTYFFKQEEV